MKIALVVAMSRNRVIGRDNALPWHAPVVVVAHSCVRSWWRAVKGEGAPERLEAYRAAVAAGLAAARMVIAPTIACAKSSSSSPR